MQLSHLIGNIFHCPPLGVKTIFRSLAQRIHYMLARNREPPAINRQQKYHIDCVEQHTSESIRCTVNVTETTLDFNLFVDSDWARLRANPKKKNNNGETNNNCYECGTQPHAFLQTHLINKADIKMYLH